MKKPLVLTGLAEETDFTADPPSGSVYYLVFNKGELRLPVAVECAAAALQFLSGQPTPRTVAPLPPQKKSSAEAPAANNIPAPMFLPGDDGSEVVPAPDSDDGVPSI